MDLRRSIFILRIFIKLLNKRSVLLLSHSVLAVLIVVVSVKPTQSFSIGEEIKFAIKKMGLKGGSSSLVFRGEDVVNGRPVYLIVFTAHALNFLDEEKIYMDQDTLYPLRVERNLNIWGRKETITEDYLQDQGVIKIAKEVNDKIYEDTLKKEGLIDNIYCFIYRFRMREQVQVGDSYRLRLPTKDITLKIKKETTIYAGGKRHDALFLESEPNDYRVWFDVAPGRIPLRIDGSVGLMSTSMILAEYIGGQQ